MAGKFRSDGLWFIIQDIETFRQRDAPMEALPKLPWTLDEIGTVMLYCFDWQEEDELVKVFSVPMPTTHCNQQYWQRFEHEILNGRLLLMVISHGETVLKFQFVSRSQDKLPPGLFTYFAAELGHRKLIDQREDDIIISMVEELMKVMKHAD